jgi:PAS domain S-box-containing protein
MATSGDRDAAGGAPPHAGEAAPEFLRAVVERIALPVFVKDDSFRFVLVNPSLCELVGRDERELLGRTDFDFFPEAQARAFREMDVRVLTKGNTVAVEEESLTDRGGCIHILRTVKAPLRAPGSEAITHIVGVIADVTRVKEAEQALRNANEDLERRVRERTAELEAAQAALLREERLAVLGQLAAGLAHQIRNPLAAIATASSILKRKLAKVDDPDAKQALTAILEEVWEANRIITDLLDYARVKPPSLTRLSVADLVEAALGEASPPGGVTIERDLDPDLEVEVDLRQTRDALANVLRNAVEAMPGGGRLLVSAQRDGADALIAVEDSGPGLTRASLAGLFEPLVTSKPLGLGLGLATARLLVENQRGTIRAATGTGRGARFEIRLPLGG